MTLVNDDEIEKAGRELSKQLLALLGACNGLIESEIDFVGSIDAPFLIERSRDFDFAAIFALNGFRAGGQHQGAVKSQRDAGTFG